MGGWECGRELLCEHTSDLLTERPSRLEACVELAPLAGRLQPIDRAMHLACDKGRLGHGRVRHSRWRGGRLADAGALRRTSGIRTRRRRHSRRQYGRHLVRRRRWRLLRR